MHNGPGETEVSREGHGVDTVLPADGCRSIRNGVLRIGQLSYTNLEGFSAQEEAKRPSRWIPLIVKAIKNSGDAGLQILPREKKVVGGDKRGRFKSVEVLQPQLPIEGQGCWGVPSLLASQSPCKSTEGNVPIVGSCAQGFPPQAPVAATHPDIYASSYLLELQANPQRPRSKHTLGYR